MTAAPAQLPPPVPLPPSSRRHHWEVFTMAAAVVVLAFLLDVRPDHEHIAFRGLGRLPLPGTCLSREWFHVSCPGCGLTRSIVFLAHGELRQSWQMHHLGWAMTLLILAQLPYRLAWLRLQRPPLGTRLPNLISYAMIVLLIGNWIVGVFA